MTTTLRQRASNFLAYPHIAVVGLSRTQANPANLIYRKLKETGHTVYAVNPEATTIEGGDPCYPNVQAIPHAPDGVVIVTRPEVTSQVVRDCYEAGIRHVWIHESLIHGGTSISDEAVQYCQRMGIDVIAGGCPLMFAEPVDFGHKCMRWVMDVTGQLPE